MEDFNLWWSVVSTVLGIIFLIGNAVQFVAAKKEKEIHKSQVKIWQHYSSGIHHGLIALGQSTYTSVKDLQEAIKSIQPSAHSLFTSLNEERLFTEKEIKQRQLDNEKSFKDLLDQAKKPQS